MQEQQQRWLLKVRELFFQVGIKSVTMDRIATHLGISKKTLYQWVTSKNDLVKLMVEAFVALDAASCKAAIEQSKNAIDELRLIRSDTMHDLEMMKANVIFDIKNYYPEAWDVMREHQRSFIVRVVGNNLRRGIVEGYYLADLDIELVSRLHGHQVFNLFNEDWFPATRFASQTVVAEFMRRYAYSIANEKGRKYLEKYWEIELARVSE